MISITIDKAKSCGGEYSLYVKFPYNDELVSVIRAFPQRAWDAEQKLWEVPTNKLKNIIEAVDNEEVEIKGNFSVYDITDTSIPADFKFKTEPFAHQVDGIEYGLKHSAWLLGDEQGLGKTKQMIDLAVINKKLYHFNHCFIVCGVNGLKWNWASEVKKHSDEQAYILGQRVRRNGITIGSTADKIYDLQHWNDIKEYFIITNVETLRDPDVQSIITDLCKSGELPMAVIDEVHRCKNPTSQQGKGILKLQPRVRVALTGTPLMNNPMDLYIILKWLGYEKHSFYSFRTHYCVMGGYGGYEVVGYRHLEDLQAQLNEIMLRRLKEDVLDLPEKTFVDEYVEMGSAQRKLYNEVTAEVQRDIDRIKMSPNPLAEMIRLRQATGDTSILSSTINESAKLDRMEEIVDDSIENGKKVVIFSNWTMMTNPAYNRLAKKYKGVTVTGETDDVTRQVNVNQFQNNPDCKFIIGTTGAMGTGLTLTAGTVVIFLDHPWNRALYDQAVDRCHRIGQTANITIYNLLCKDTIDERIWELVNLKGAMSDILVDGKTSRPDVVEFLLS